jgi:protein-tyrosine phosphatase
MIRLIDVHCIRIPVNDVSGENISRYFDDVADKINSIGVRNEKVLIHCVAGVSRSATLVLAYLMKYHNMSLRDSYRYLYERRPVVRPNVSFFRQLIGYEKQLFGTTSVAMTKMLSFDDEEIEVPDLYVVEYRRMALMEAFIRKSKRRSTRS